MVIPCRSADIKCPWTGQRDQLNQHLVDCRFELMRPVITQFIAENQQLKDQVNQQTIKITSRENIIETHLSLQKQLLSEVERQQKENQQLKDQGNEQTIYIGEQQRVIRQLTTEVTQLTTQFNACQRQLQHLNAQTSQKNTQITSMANQSSE
jgi:chromosome segregation ATPase